jgi:hypothetical protein
MVCIDARPVARATVCRATKTLCYKSFNLQKFSFKILSVNNIAWLARHAIFLKVRRGALESHHV